MANQQNRPNTDRQSDVSDKSNVNQQQNDRSSGMETGRTSSQPGTRSDQSTTKTDISRD